MQVELVIFDCDGVLVDSEIIVHRVGAQVMNRLGFPLTVEKSIELFAGLANQDLNEIIYKEYGRKVTATELEMIVHRIETSIYQEVQPIPGIIPVVHYLAERAVNRSIASNSNTAYLATVLRSTTIENYFAAEQIFSATMVPAGKPEPDLFLYVAEKLQVKPENCLVIEDSVVGITAAQAAKMPVIGFLGGTHAQYPTYNDYIKNLQPWKIAYSATELLNILQLYL